MSNERSFSIKVFLLSGDGKRTREVRRFPIQEGVSTSFMYVEQKIKTILELEQNKPIQILWEDAEGDRVSMSSDDELLEAIGENLSFRKLPTLKLYVIPKARNTPGWSLPFLEVKLAENLHVGVVCDACDKDLCGVRFKCLTCPDYDLCSDCKASNIHCQHVFIDLGLPDDDSSCPVRKAWERSDRSFRRREARNHRIRECRKKFNPNSKDSCSGKEKTKDDTKSEENNSSGCDHPRAKIFENLRNPDLFSGYEEMLQTDPLANGVKLTIDVMKNMFSAWSGEFERATTKPNAGESSSKTGESSSNAEESSSKAEESSSKAEESSSKAEESSSKAEESSSKAEENSTNKSTSISSQEMVEEDVEDCPVRQNPSNESSLGEEISKLSGKFEAMYDGDKKTDANVVEPMEVEKPSTPEWTMIEENDDDIQVISTTKEAEVPSASSNVYPVLEEAAAPIPQVSSAPQESLEHESSRIKDSLQYMKTMGYSDEGGWLTRLLTLKNGDINKVLDILMAPHKK